MDRQGGGTASIDIGALQDISQRFFGTAEVAQKLARIVEVTLKFQAILNEIPGKRGPDTAKQIEALENAVLGAANAILSLNDRATVEIGHSLLQADAREHDVDSEQNLAAAILWAKVELNETHRRLMRLCVAIKTARLMGPKGRGGPKNPESLTEAISLLGELWRAELGEQPDASSNRDRFPEFAIAVLVPPPLSYPKTKVETEMERMDRVSPWETD